MALALAYAAVTLATDRHGLPEVRECRSRPEAFSARSIDWTNSPFLAILWDYLSIRMSEKNHLSNEEAAAAYAEAVLEDSSWQRPVEHSLSQAKDPEHARQQFTEAVIEQGQRHKENAERDHITGLPNQRAFEVVLDQMADRAARKAHPEKRERKPEATGTTALVGLDLEGFGEINNKFGWTRGSKILAEVAQAFESELRPNDFVARIGGDELALLLDNTTDSDEVFKTLSRVEAHLPENPVTRKRIQINPDKLVIEFLSDDDSPDAIKTALDRALEEMRKEEQR